MSGQPSGGGGGVTWYFDLTSVTPTETGGIGPSVIVNSPNTFTLTATISNTGTVAGGLVGTHGMIEYHCEKEEDGTRVTLTSVPFTVANAASSSSGQLVTSPAYGSAGGPNALNVGTWEITAHVHFPGTAYAGIVAAFTSYMLEII